MAARLVVFATLLMRFILTAHGEHPMCYTPAGVPLNESLYTKQDWWQYKPCNSNLSVPSTCCKPGETCSRDNLCRDAEGHAYRQYCTQRDWNTPHCSHVCLADYRDAGVELTFCPKDRSLCCGVKNKCCQKGPRFKIDMYGNIIHHTTSGDSSSFQVAVGVGVGVGAPALIGFMVAAFCIGRRRRRRKMEAKHAQNWGKAELDSGSQSGGEKTLRGSASSVVEKGSDEEEVHEMDDERNRPELPRNELHELDDDSNRAELPDSLAMKHEMM